MSVMAEAVLQAAGQCPVASSGTGDAVAEDAFMDARRQVFGRLQLDVFSGADNSFVVEACPEAADLLYLRRGRGEFKREGTAELLEGHMLYLLDPGVAYRLRFAGSFEARLLRMPAEEVRAMVGDCQGLKQVGISACCGPAAIFVNLLEAVSVQHHMLSPADFKGCSAALLEVLGGALRAHARQHLDEVSVAERYHRERVKAFARDHLGNPELDVKLIAEAVGVSASYIHRLFASSGQTLMQWISGERLDACHRELSLPCELKRPVYAVAQDWGFNNQAHFSRAFRARFGISPSAVRQNGQNCACDPA